MPKSGDHDFAFPNGGAADQNASPSRQPAATVSGIAVGQPLGENRAGRAKQDNRWGYAGSGQTGASVGTDASQQLKERVTRWAQIAREVCDLVFVDDCNDVLKVVHDSVAPNENARVDWLNLNFTVFAK